MQAEGIGHASPIPGVGIGQKGSDATVPFDALAEADKLEVLHYAVSVKQEAAFLADEVIVKNQTITGLANGLAEQTAQCNMLKEQCQTSDVTLERAKDEIARLRLALQDAAPRTAELELQTTAQEEALRVLKAEMVGNQSKMDAVTKLEENNQRLEAEHHSMTETLEVWKSRVKEALKEHRRKEQAQERTEIELKTQLNLVQTQLNEAQFNLQSYKLRDGRKEEGDVSVGLQTDEDLLDDLVTERIEARGYAPATHQLDPAHSGHLDPAAPFSPRSVSRVSQNLSTPPVPLRSQSRPNPQKDDATTPRQQSNAGAGGMTSPNPVAPTPVVQAPPMIIAVHFGTKEGWTVDTKHAVKPGMTVTDLTRNCCNSINARYSQNLDEQEMVLKIHHGKAKRLVTLQEQRELHSFAVFHKYVKEKVPIVLSLDHKKDEPWDEFLSPRFTAHQD